MHKINARVKRLFDKGFNMFDQSDINAVKQALKAEKVKLLKARKSARAFLTKDSQSLKEETEKHADQLVQNVTAVSSVTHSIVQSIHKQQSAAEKTAESGSLRNGFQALFGGMKNIFSGSVSHTPRFIQKNQGQVKPASFEHTRED